MKLPATTEGSFRPKPRVDPIEDKMLTSKIVGSDKERMILAAMFVPEAFPPVP